jgi:hypothetical protein
MSLEVAPIRAHHPLILGPSTTEVNLFVASLMKERNEDNFVIWDLVHGVEVLATTIFENINQAVRVSSMRDDFKGLTPLHVLALQGKIDQINELRVLVLEKIGGRGLLHFMALGGHIRHEGVRAYLAHSGENIARDLDEYSGSALDIAKIVEEKKATLVLGKFHICESHIPAVDLLKIWLMVRPEEPFLKRVREDREFEKGVIFSGKPEDAIELRETSGELGVEALASKDISFREEVSFYVGLFSASAMFSSLSDLCLIKKEAKSYFREEEINYENCDGIVDATEVCNKSVFINDGLPNVFLLSRVFC